MTGDRPDHLHRWLEAALRSVSAELSEALSEEISQIGLRRLRVLQLVPAEGTRQQALVARADVTKQAVAESVASLEERGLVERRPDPSDGRSWLVVPTRAGTTMQADLEHSLDAFERRFARSVGAADYTTFMKVLRTLAAQPAIGEEAP